MLSLELAAFEEEDLAFSFRSQVLCAGGAGGGRSPGRGSAGVLEDNATAPFPCGPRGAVCTRGR